MMVAVLQPGDRLRAIDLTIEATQADAVVVCGEAPVQAAVAAVAAARDLPFACMPAGPDDLLARDLGMPLDDPAEALKLPFAGAERTIDLGEVNGLPFVNRVAVGVELPAAAPWGRPGRPERSRRRTAPRTFAQAGAGALLVCNDRFELLEDRLGRRDWPDEGRLQVVTFETPGTDRSFAALRAAGFQEHVCTRFQLALRNAVVVDLDGERCRLVPPLRFRTVAAALRVRAPSIEPHSTDAAGARDQQQRELIQTG
jgi:diacylglycerol kinase family enzyme